MNICIDVREACRPNRTGKGQWTYGFVSELLSRDVPLILITDTPVPTEWNIADVRVFSRGWKWHISAFRFLKRHSDYLYVATTSFIVPFLLGQSVSYTPVIHDLIAFRSEPHDRKATLIEWFTIGRTLAFARHILAISNQTKLDLLHKYSWLRSDSITPIFAGPMNENVPMNSHDLKTILCIGTLCPRKNQQRLVEAYALLPSHLCSQYSLVLAGGRGWNDDSILTAVQKTAGAQWKGYIDPTEYDRLLSTCTVLALPSLYEGFGMQVLDALQRGVPVLTSDRGSLKEVAGDAAVVVDPLSVDSIAGGLTRILEDSSLRDSLRIAGPKQVQKFSWKHTVDLFLQAAASYGV